MLSQSNTEKVGESIHILKIDSTTGPNKTKKKGATLELGGPVYSNLADVN